MTWYLGSIEGVVGDGIFAKRDFAQVRDIFFFLRKTKA